MAFSCKIHCHPITICISNRRAGEWYQERKKGRTCFLVTFTKSAITLTLDQTQTHQISGALNWMFMPNVCKWLMCSNKSSFKVWITQYATCGVLTASVNRAVVLPVPLKCANFCLNHIRCIQTPEWKTKKEWEISANITDTEQVRLLTTASCRLSCCLSLSFRCLWKVKCT